MELNRPGLADAVLWDADLGGVDFGDVRNLTKKQIESDYYPDGTLFCTFHLRK